jgi:hypothetical protein
MRNLLPIHFCFPLIWQICFFWQNGAADLLLAAKLGLAALLELARVADRVGRIGGHTFMPPLKTSLDLERAAANYAESQRDYFCATRRSGSKG